MSKQDARKITVIEELLNGRFSNQEAAQLLDLSVRQIQRLKAEAAKNGVTNILHKHRGRKPSNCLDPAIAAGIVSTYLNELTGYNFCHTADVLAEDKGIFVSPSTVSRYLKANGIRSPKAKRRPKKHRSRNARAAEGELAQMDASRFDWLGNGSYLHLHGAVDDATGRLLGLHFDQEETHAGYCELILQMGLHGQLPRELYTDARSVFVYSSKKKKELTLAEELAGIPEQQTQFARAMRELGILLIIARSPQAKGAIERLWGTLQDRLPKDMKRRGITTIEAANAFLKDYIPYFNRKFAVLAGVPDKVYLPCCHKSQLQFILAKHEIRKLDAGLAFSFAGQKYCLPPVVNGIKIPASPHDTITVATSSHIGVQVIFKGLVFQPVPLRAQPKASLVQDPSVRKKTASSVSASPSPHPDASPHIWRRYTTMFYSKSKKDDILADQLSAR